MHFGPKPLQLELWEWLLFCHNGEENSHVYFKQHAESKTWSSLLIPGKFYWTQWKLHLKSLSGKRIRSCKLSVMPIKLISVSKLIFFFFYLNETWESSHHYKQTHCTFLSAASLLSWVHLDTSDISHIWKECSQGKWMWQRYRPGSEADTATILPWTSPGENCAHLSV